MVQALPEDTKMCVDEDRTVKLNAGRTLCGQARVGVRTGTSGDTLWLWTKLLDELLTSSDADK
eukprot:9395097-Pyramimonas_sp.AAC.1